MTQPGATTTQPRPTPLTVALGLVATGVRGARRLPFKAVQLPVLALNSALVLREGVKREYDELAERGEAVLSRLRGRTSGGLGEDVADGARQVLRTGVAATAGLASDVADGIEELADRVEDAAESVADKASGLARGAAERASASVPGSGDSDGDPATTDPKGEATPSRDDTPLSHPGTAATAEVVAVVEQVTEQLSTGEPVAHTDLPLADYDHMTLGSLRGRLRSLTPAQLVVVRDYEKAHANRLPVVTMLDNRIAKLQADAAQPAQDGPGRP